MFNVKLYTTFNSLFIVIFSLKSKLIKKPLFLIPDVQHMNSCDFKEIIVSMDFEFENGMLVLDRDCYLSIVKFLNSSILREV
jgi:hypothetical protein